MFAKTFAKVLCCCRGSFASKTTTHRIFAKVFYCYGARLQRDNTASLQVPLHRCTVVAVLFCEEDISTPLHRYVFVAEVYFCCRALLRKRQHRMFAMTCTSVTCCCGALLRSGQHRMFAKMRSCLFRKRALQQLGTYSKACAKMLCCLGIKRARKRAL